MQRESDDINKSDFNENDLHEMEERRVQALNDAGIDEHKILTDCTKNQNSFVSYFGENITRGKDDLNFCIRDQWTAIERSEFTRLFSPAMTFNKLYDSTKKIVGEQRKNKPDLIVRSLNGKIDQEQLDIRGDLVRTISYRSQNDLVYQTAFKSALMFSYGAFQVGLGYESPRSFNRTIDFQLIPDPTRCAWDPTALKPHKGDGNFCTRNFTMLRDEFFVTYPYISNPVSFVDPYMLLDFQWTTKDTICICDEYVKEWYPLTIVKLSNGMSVTEKEWEEAQKIHQKQLDVVQGSIVAQIIQDGIPYVKEKRMTQDYKIMHYRMIRDTIIEFSEWPSKQLPIIFVDGDSYYLDGRQYTKSFIHEARDAQKSLNYFNSQIVGDIKNRRREQWLGTADNITGYEQIWRNPEQQSGILLAKPDPKSGMMPQKQTPWDMSPALMQNAQRATQDIKEIMGFSEQEVLMSRDMSGKARRERKLEGGLAAYVYFDNLNQAIEQAGRIVNDLLPYIVGKDERHMTISKPDGKTSGIIFNHMQKNGSVTNKLMEGDFDVEIDTGPSFAVQKEIALEFLQQTLQAFPQAFPLIADLWAKNLDVQFMPQMVERFKTMVPPDILAKENGEKAPPPQPNPQQMMAQHQMMMQQQEMKDKQTELSQKAQQIKLDADRVHNETLEVLTKMRDSHDKKILENSKLMADLEKTGLDAHNKEQERHVDLYKTNLDHLSQMTNSLTSSSE